LININQFERFCRSARDRWQNHSTTGHSGMAENAGAPNQQIVVKKRLLCIATADSHSQYRWEWHREGRKSQALEHIFVMTLVGRDFPSNFACWRKR